MDRSVYYDILHEKARRMMLRKAQAGGLPGCAPVGYLNKRRGEKTWVDVDPDKGPLVVAAFELVVEGKLSLRKVIATLTELGLTSRTGKQVGISSLWSILTNPFYYGTMYYRGDLLPGNHTPLVSRELWNQTQVVLMSRRR
jgi:site-specific DNA recombinase